MHGTFGSLPRSILKRPYDPRTGPAASFVERILVEWARGRGRNWIESWMRPSIAPRICGSRALESSRDRFLESHLSGERGTRMKRSFGALALLTAVVLLPSVAEARGYGRHGGSGTVNTPFGQFPMSTMQQAGGNPYMAQQ